MQLGISTASLNGKMNTEDALAWIGRSGVDCAEVFLTTFCEYREPFARVLADVQRETGVRVGSMHTLNTQYEGQLFSFSQRQRDDAFALLESALQVGSAVGAQCYVLHGPAQIKYMKYHTNYENFARRGEEIAALCGQYGMRLTWETVHWAHYNHPDFIDRLAQHTDRPLYTTLDIKQAMQSGCDYMEYLRHMAGGRLQNVHICDFDQEGSLCLPLKGQVDFAFLFEQLRRIGYDGAVMLEVYDHCFRHPDELLESYRALKQLMAEVNDK